MQVYRTICKKKRQTLLLLAFIQNNLLMKHTISYYSNTVSAVEQVHWHLPVLAILSHGPLVSSGHFTLIAGFTGRTHFDGGVLKRCSCDCHLVTTLYRSRVLNSFSTDASNFTSVKVIICICHKWAC